MLEWLVLADDRTGALEVAGELAASFGPVPVAVRHPDHAGSAQAVVIDTGSRHLAADHAAALVAEHSTSTPARRCAHKIDSLLRGNWAHELVAAHRATGHRILVVAAFPAVGRTCRGGIVHVDGEPSADADVRTGPASARPADHLIAAGAEDVVELRSAAEIAAWSTAFAVCDAVTDDDLRAIGLAWRTTNDVRFAGTSGSIAAAAATRAVATRAVDVPGDDRAAPVRFPAGASRPIRIEGPVLVVCGSRHPVALAQIARLATTAASVDVAVLQPPTPVGAMVPAADAERTATELGTEARRRVGAGQVATLVIIGGDTAAAVLGDVAMVAGGTVAPGMPWARRADGTGPLVITKAGGFGRPETLVELLLDRP